MAGTVQGPASGCKELNTADTDMLEATGYTDALNVGGRIVEVERRERNWVQRKLLRNRRRARKKKRRC